MLARVLASSSQDAGRTRVPLLRASDAGSSGTSNARSRGLVHSTRSIVVRAMTSHLAPISEHAMHLRSSTRPGVSRGSDRGSGVVETHGRSGSSSGGRAGEEAVRVRRRGAPRTSRGGARAEQRAGFAAVVSRDELDRGAAGTLGCIASCSPTSMTSSISAASTQRLSTERVSSWLGAKPSSSYFLSGPARCLALWSRDAPGRGTVVRCWAGPSEPCPCGTHVSHRLERSLRGSAILEPSTVRRRRWWRPLGCGRRCDVLRTQWQDERIELFTSACMTGVRRASRVGSREATPGRGASRCDQLDSVGDGATAFA